ncbi:PQQ-binding-like beta-propeller repeat protein [Streptomyces sp. NPDC048182]|uniref:protein kinase domain-containing protein n=1 Tax=Streptomyces sp. NPDC048182 TaxID=3365507 RepID=UPI003713B6CA
MAASRNAGAGEEAAAETARPVPAERPAQAGHYRLESCLGSGGMGVVHLARSASGMRLAVKVVHAEFAEDPEFRGRFRQEVAAARRVSGAFTAPVVDADPDAERPWMATLFIPGPTLAEHVKLSGPMEAGQVRQLMAGLAEALRDIHRVGVVHRDLKPSNVLLAEDGPKVIDFGISRPKDSELRTETGKLIGTPPFMAPEQFRRPRQVGPAADVFALGSLMVHAATGRGPFDSDSPYVVAYQVVHDEPDLTGVPGSLAPLVRRCLAKDPDERPTPDELMRELRSVAASYDTQTFIPAQRDGSAAEPAVDAPVVNGPAVGGPAPDDPVAAASPPRRRPGRRTLALVAGAAALCLAVVGGVVAVQGRGDAGPAGRGGEAAPGGFGAWRSTPDGGEGASQCSYGAGRLLCARSGLVYALDPADGDTLWRHPVAPGARSAPPVVAGGFVQPALDRVGPLEGLDPATGEPAWRHGAAEGPAYGAARPAGGMLLLTGVAGRTGRVGGLDGASGAVRWTRDLPGRTGATVTVAGGEAAAYVARPAEDGKRTRVTALDPATGAVRWDRELAGALTPVGAEGGSVYFTAGGAGGTVTGDVDAVVRYRPADGSVRRVALPVPVVQAEAAVRGQTVYLMGSGGALAAVDLAAGEQSWRLETGVSRGSAPVADGRHVYVAAPDGRLLGVDAVTGRLLGQTPPRLGGEGDRVPSALPAPVLAGGHVYAGAPDGSVFGVDGRDPADW